MSKQKPPAFDGGKSKPQGGGSSFDNNIQQSNKIGG